MRDLHRVGYLGGTFDPPHLGHAIIAREAFLQLNLDAVMWLITPNPPHKKDREITPVQYRLDMLELATGKYDEFSTSSVDLERSPPYYAAGTVEIIKNNKPDRDLVYIIGEDSLQDLPEWYEPELFLATIDELAVAPRPGFSTDLEVLGKKLPGLQEKVVFLAEVMVEISSSLIRERIKGGIPYDHFLLQDIADYIKKNGLYQA